jgi:WD40 repeat protein/serine/threonine protein kinase
MNPEPDEVLDDEFGTRLEAYDEALAQGGSATLPGEEAPAELRARLQRGRTCLELLQQLRPRSLSAAPDTSKIRGPGASAPTPAPAEEVPTGLELIGRFEIRRMLGSGGFGVVYLAYDPVLCREVALKIPRAAVLADADWMARFQREARAAAALNHPNLVQVYEAGQLGPVYYITLAYCPGHNLAQWLKLQTAPVPCAEAARLLVTLARAIHYAHERGVLHRDLKPANVLLSTESKVPSTESQEQLRTQHPTLSTFIPRITDFGLAKLLEPGEHGTGAQTEGGAVLGTPSYMAPEQAEGRLQEVSPATDVYALGTILYEVITGRPPFWGDTPVAVFWQVKTTEPLAPSRLRVNLPRDLETICLRCLQKEPRRRYASAEALADDLDRFLAHRPIQARPISRVEHLAKWVRRHTAFAATLAALALVTILGVAGILWQWLRTENALTEKAEALVQARQAQEASEVSLSHHRVVLAHREWLAANVGRASQLLTEVPDEHRAWEWHYVRHLCDSNLLTLRGHTGPVVRVAFSPDGRRLASVAGVFFSDQPGEVRVWDAASGELLWIGLGHTGPVMGLAFSPDGRLLASSSTVFPTGTGEVKVWDLRTGKTIQTLPTHGCYGVAFSPDGKLLASCGIGVQAWDWKIGKRLAHFDSNLSSVFDVAFSPNGRLLASVNWYGKARLWDASALASAPNSEPVRTLSGPNDLRGVAFSPDSKRLVAAGYGQFAKVWDLTDGQMLLSYWGHRAAVLHAVYSPDGRWIASADSGGDVHIWDAQTGRLFRRIRGHTGSVPCVTFSPDGLRLATSGDDRTVRLWDFTREQESIQLQDEEVRSASGVVFSPDGKLLAASGYRHSSGSRVNNVRIWPVDQWSSPRQWTGHEDWVTCVAFSPHGKYLASGSEDQSIRLWDTAAGETVLTLTGHRKQVTGVAFSPDGKCLVSASLDGTIKRWDLAWGRLLTPELTPPHGVHDVLYLRSGHVLAAGDDGMITAWDPETGKVLFSLNGPRQEVDRLALSRDGGLLASAGRGSTICLWDLATEPPAGTELKPRRLLVGPSDNQRITGLAFSADGRRLAACGQDHTVRIWNVTSGDETLTLRGHQDTVLGVAFSPDGRLLASASPQGIKIWEASDAPGGQTGPGAPQALAWYRQQADECETADPPQWSGVAFHLGRLLEAEPRDWRNHARRSQAAAELGDWPRTLDYANRAIARGAVDPYTWHLQALARLQQADLPGYRQSCADLVRRFGQTAGAEPANNVAWTCALAPAAVPDLQPVIRLIATAAKEQRERALFQNTLGALLYRANQLPAARSALEESVRLSRGGVPEDWVFLAMVCDKRGDKAAARVWLDKVTHWQPPPGHPFSLRRQAEINLLRREAEALLAGRP